MKRPTHKIANTACGGAVAADAFAAAWRDVTCPACLDKRARPGADACVERDCREDQLCRLCRRCKAHCIVRLPNDPPAHHARWQSVSNLRGHRKADPRR